MEEGPHQTTVIIFCARAIQHRTHHCLLPSRTTFIKPIDGTRGHRVDDEWTIEPQPSQTQQWTGSTNFGERITYKEEIDDDEYQHTSSAIPAKATKTPAQPTHQEIIEHNLTHMPYRDWCPICVQGRGKASAHQKQRSRKPIIQIDFAFMRGFNDPMASPVLTAIDVETGLCTAALIPNKQSMMDYCINTIIAFIMETGRTTCILQSDSEPYLKAIVNGVASRLGHITVRFTPAYSSQSQGSVERFHCTLISQIRVLREHIKQNYNTAVNMNHPIMAWMIKHSSFLINNYLIHQDGYTSYYRRWGVNNNTPICEFAETILYMPSQAVKSHPKLENRFYPGIWLVKDPSSGESYVGIAGRVIKARSIRRQIKPHKYSCQHLDIVNGNRWAPSTFYSPTFILPTTQPQ